jgi:hypothetical protein
MLKTPVRQAIVARIPQQRVGERGDPGQWRALGEHALTGSRDASDR